MKRNLIRIIHTGKSCLGWDDETYRDVLFRQTGKRSARDCSVSELEKTVLYMRTQGFAPSSRGRRPRVATGRKAILSKIEALLADAGRPWGYLDGITERMLGEKKPVEWLNDEQLYKVMQMLIVDAARHGRL
ncbi:regulatory protein GemA [Salmonella enterica subsp. enterica]|uniref:Regulatory protein GemA n=1 Tax=Salmonella enterica subsp. enterica serovar Kottbus TaxID=224727 RepID=A0A5J0SED3_SALET|nr:regulatory protein GemA [Salmonella enterica subsp. enterica serovar Newport]EBQ9797674.1 regulatory protein GemA [Salmonella enterica subsp. enterica serovar Kottbus]ECA9706320.1 regulatory protein GemA [Salmonella enterica subsp. enterica serovar Bredeney]ECI3497678.1 regulatory protein GemA [Salmonella enterica subsp. salamae]EDM0595337.1 regulatory protein GemA [Salmonella enterica subsp. enterica serovar Cerro]EDN4396875.1 regulatory protein GemA [Salmonella enterica subsp. enterica]E